MADADADLHRSFGIVRATAMVVGTIIGASIFVQPSLISGAVPSVTGILAIWAGAGLLTLIGSLAAAELASAYPRTGGVYVYLSEAFSPVIGFLWGWAMLWVMHSGIVAAIAMIFARYVGYFLPLNDTGIRLVAMAAILLLSAVNYVGVRYGSALQTGFTIVKVLAIVLIIVLGFTLGGGIAGGAAASPAILPTREAIVAALIAGLFAFGGWHMVTYTAGETIDARRTVPRALLIGTLTVTVCYIGLNAAYLRVLPLETVAASTRVAADFADALVGSGGAVMSALVIVSTFGALTGIILTGPRVYLSMANDGLLFSWLGTVHAKFRTPHRAILLQAVWSSVLVATGTYGDLFRRVIYTEWIFFGLMVAGIFVLRRRPAYAPAYRIWGYPFLPALFILATAGIVVSEMLSAPRRSITGLLLVLAGLPVYAIFVRRRHQQGAARAGR